MIYTIIDKHGEIVSLISCLEIDLAANTPEGCEAVEGDFSGKFFDGESWVPCPEKPISNGYQYNRETHKWEFDSVLFQDQKAVQDKTVRQQSLNDPVEFKGDWYQADEKSLTAMVTSYNVMLAITGQKIDWKLANNEFREVSVDDLQQLIKMIFERNQKIIKGP